MAEKFLDISKELPKARNRVYRVGVELEGGWTKLPDGVSNVDHDGSVQFEDVIIKANTQAWDRAGSQFLFFKGELPSPPLLPEGKDILTLEKWLKSHYPDKINHTCGMHVHMSFRNAFQYMTLMQESYMWTIIEFVSKWAHGKKEFDKKDHPIWPRLQGKSEYCQHVFHADDQAQKQRKEFDHFAKGHRYTVINFPFTRQGTIECRLLPMMPTVDLAIEAVREIMKITSAFLLKKAQEDGSMLDGKLAAKGEKELSNKWVADVGDSTHIETIEVTT